MKTPTFIEILDHAEELAWTEHSHEIAIALAYYPAPLPDALWTRRNALIDKAYFRLTEQDSNESKVSIRIIKHERPQTPPR